MTEQWVKLTKAGRDACLFAPKVNNRRLISSAQEALVCAVESLLVYGFTDNGAVWCYTPAQLVRQERRTTKQQLGELERLDTRGGYVLLQAHEWEHA